jgi:lycopene cyclase domain-containing protein
MFQYMAYLALMALGSFALAVFFGPEIPFKRLALSLLLAVPVFFVWDFLAVERGHWSFNADKVLGFFVLNQPIEEVLFFIIAVSFYVILWEAARKWSTSTRPQ